jgi:chaperonin GroEL
LVVNDGATIAQEINGEDRFEKMGARIIQEVAATTKIRAGGGTTTATLLAQYIIHEGFRLVAAGVNPIEMKRGIQGATQVAAAAIDRLAKPITARESIAQVATISAEDPAIGEMIAEAMERVGSEGVITVSESESWDTVLDFAEGMRFERGYLSPEMVTDREKMIAELDHPYVLITDRKITDPQELIPLLNVVVEQDRSLLIIAEGIEGSALGTLIVNKRDDVLDAVAVHPPAYGEGRRARMDDLAVWTGATFITEEMGSTLSEATIEMLGSAASVRVTRNNTVIVGGAGDEKVLNARISSLKALVAKTEYDFDKKQLEERLARMRGGVAVIKVGGGTEAVIKERRLRFEDALNSARAAVAEGVVPGGGVAFLNTIPAVKAYVETLSDDMKVGAAIILGALEQPIRQIAANANREGGVIVAEVTRRATGTGFDAATGAYVDMIASGIIDPAQMARLALLNAASASVVLLTTEAAVATIQRRGLLS